MKTHIHITYMQILTVSLFITAQTWKQPRGPSVVECINYGASRQ